MHNTKNYVVESATPADLADILAILEKQLLVNKDQSVREAVEQSGFLISKPSTAELLQWIEDKQQHLTLVCKAGKEIVGYLLGCDVQAVSTELKGKFLSVAAVRELLSKQTPLFYHKQIAVKPDCPGAGSLLLEKGLELVKQRGYPSIVCLIVHQPFFNKVSLAFHQKRGFECLGEVELGGMIDGVYLKHF